MFYLLLLTLDGEERSLAERLYEKYKDRMYTIAYSILHNEQDAEDAVEDAAIKIIKNICAFKDIPCNKIDALIVLYSKCSAIDIHRKRKISPILTIDDADTPEIADDSKPLEDIVIDSEFISTMQKYIEELKTEYKEILICKYYYENSDREIAELLKINENAVRTRLTRARDMLRKKMGEKDD